ncbi:MAG: nucleotidyltransferase family protein, partial [Clostridia bacterium]|nr:nucleotidyltransferase family protein [Clostridia bacterium]
MEICAIICEFNPFHNGHAYLLRRARELSGCDAVLCVMSGSFTQRGEICRTDKFLRAKHAVLCGADAVVELPAPFAVAPAEIFARGAVGVISSIPQVKCVAFGCESGEAEDFLYAAKIANSESALFKATLEKHLDSGESYI